MCLTLLCLCYLYSMCKLTLCVKNMFCQCSLDFTSKVLFWESQTSNLQQYAGAKCMLCIWGSYSQWTDQLWCLQRKTLTVLFCHCLCFCICCFYLVAACRLWFHHSNHSETCEHSVPAQLLQTNRVRCLWLYTTKELAGGRWVVWQWAWDFFAYQTVQGIPSLQTVRFQNEDWLQSAWVYTKDGSSVKQNNEPIVFLSL